MKKYMTGMFVFLAAASLAFAAGGAEKSGQVTLNFMETMTSANRTTVIKGIIADYEASHPGVKINLISPSYDDAQAKASQTMAAKGALDIIEVRDITASQYITNKWIEDLSPYIAKWSDWNDFLPTAKGIASAAGGKPFVIPQFCFVPALFVRTDVLKKLGVTDYPKTMGELFALCEKITDPAKNQFGWTIRGRSNSFRQSDLLTVADLSNLDRDNIYRLSNGTSIFDSPEYLASFTRFVNLFKNACPSDGVNWGFNEQINSFVSGITPFLMQDPDAVPAIDEFLSRDQYTVIPMPPGASGKFYYEPGFASLGITTYSAHKDAAWDFITYMSEATRNAAICKAYGALPVHSSTFTKDDYFSSGVYQAWATVLGNPDIYVTVRYPYTSEKYPGWGQVHEQYQQSTFLGKTTPAEALRAWSSYWK